MSKVTYNNRSLINKLPPGVYYIGDPCYLIDDKEWQAALMQTRYFNLFVRNYKDSFGRIDNDNEHNPRHLQHGIFERRNGANTQLFAVSTTAYGDGEYPCYVRDRWEKQKLGNCPVDAGCIAAIPVGIAGQQSCEKAKRLVEKGLGLMYEFSTPFTVEYDGGDISFGPLTIKTDDWDEEDEWED